MILGIYSPIWEVRIISLPSHSIYAVNSLKLEINHNHVFYSPKKTGSQKCNAEKFQRKRMHARGKGRGDGDLQQLEFCGAVQFYNIQVVHRNEIVANSHCSAIMYRDIRFCGARQFSALQVIYTVISSWVFSWNTHADCYFPCISFL